MNAKDTTEPDPRALAELSALADGTLEPRRAAALGELLARSPDMRRRYEREVQAVDAIHALRADRAPAHLRLAVGARGRPAPVHRPRFRLAYGGSFAVAVAVVVAALVLLLPGGPGALSVSDAAALALRGPAMAPPMPDHSHGGSRLGQDVGEVYFPDWSRLHWTPVGQRIDHVDNRLAVTVYYASGAKLVAYTIVDSPALGWPGTAEWRLRGVELQGLRSGSRMIVTWRRAGHTCVLSGSGISPQTLSQLALTA
jgi:anti-sigma factor RsiW